MSQFHTTTAESDIFKLKENFGLPSSFIPIDEIYSNIFPKDECIAQLYEEIYSQDGDVDNITKILSYHADYLKDYHKFTSYLMYSKGALSYEARHYIAIIASSRHRCYYLVKQHEDEFKQLNGQYEWLNGLEHIPQKLRDLYEINKLLAHQPWLLTRGHIKKILRGKFSWSITELIMAITILTHFHALSGFIFGCGINEQFMQLYEQQLLNDIENQSHCIIATVGDGETGAEGGAQSEHKGSEKASALLDCLSEKDSLRCLTTNSMSLNNSSSQLMSGSNGAGVTAASTTCCYGVDLVGSRLNAVSLANGYMLKYISEPEFSHQDIHNSEPKLEYFTWEDHGYITGCSLYPDICKLLDRTFRTAFNMTYDDIQFNMSNSNNFKELLSDRNLFRRTIWIYIHFLFGIRYDDFDYNLLKTFSRLQLSNYIKLICFYPEKIVKKDYDNIMKEFTHSERVHINIVIMEARKQASLLYSFRAITDYYCSNVN